MRQHFMSSSVGSKTPPTNNHPYTSQAPTSMFNVQLNPPASPTDPMPLCWMLDAVVLYKNLEKRYPSLKSMSTLSSGAQNATYMEKQLICSGLIL